MKKILFVLAVLSLTRSVLNAENTDKKETRSVKWYSGFQLDDFVKNGNTPYHFVKENKPLLTLEGIKKQINLGWIDCFDVHNYNENKTKQKTRNICNCGEYFLAYFKKVDQVESVHSDWTIYYWRGLTCFAAQIILNAKPAQRSCIDDLKIDRNIAKRLPAEMSDRYYNYWGRAEKSFKNTRKSWAEIDEITKGVEMGDGAKLESSIAFYKVEKVATGDFDGDGVEDIMLFVNSEYKEGHDSTSSVLFVLTKLNEHGPVIVLDRNDGSYDPSVIENSISDFWNKGEKKRL